MPTLTEAIERLELGVQLLLEESRPITQCDEIVGLIISILSSGLYPGLTSWSIFKLLQRLDSQEMASHPLGRRLRFACKTVSIITSTLTDQNDHAKANAFVKCALNTGHLTAITELLSCIGTIDRHFKLDDADEGSSSSMHDVWAYLLSGGVDTNAVDGLPTVGRLLEPFIADGVNILRSMPGSALEQFYTRFICALSQIGGPRLSSYLEMRPLSGDGGLFKLDLEVNYQTARVEHVYPSEKCLTSTRKTEELTSPVSKRRIVKKVVVKRKVAKAESASSPMTETLSQDTQLSTTTEHGADETLVGTLAENPTEFHSSNSFLQSKLNFEELLRTSHELLNASKSEVLLAPRRLTSPERGGLDRDWVDSVVNTLTQTPPMIKSSIERRIDLLSLKLEAELM